MSAPLEPESLPGHTTQVHTPSRKVSANTHRLLYRGSLSLPDSHLLLDGLTFTTNTVDIFAGNSPSTSLLENPLALGLESMRGRPLHFKGTEKLHDLWLDSAVDIHVYIHQYSTITQIYFENVFCLSAITSSSGRTETGIRVGLSDTSSTDDLMIYGELRQQPPDSIDPLPSSSSNPPQVLCILAARILPNRPARIPRPDDPTPRKPSAYLNSSGSTNTKRKRDLSSTNPDIGHADSSKRARSIKGKGRAGEDDEDEQVKLAREVMLHLPKPVASGSSLPRLLGRDARPGKSTDTFKVPAVPVRAHSQPVGKDNPANHADVFGVEPGAHGSAAERPGSDELEKANKTVIKQAAMTCLAKHGIRKGHPEFNEIFSATYRGAAFALRNVTRIQAVNTRSVDKLLEAHARIYVLGNGDTHAAADK